MHPYTMHKQHLDDFSNINPYRTDEVLPFGFSTTRRRWLCDPQSGGKFTAYPLNLVEIYLQELLISSSSKAKLFFINKLEMSWNGGQWNHGCVTRASYSSEWKGFHCTGKRIGLNNNCNQSFQGAV